MLFPHKRLSHEERRPLEVINNALNAFGIVPMAVDLAEAVGVVPQTMSKILARLEDLKCISRPTRGTRGLRILHENSQRASILPPPHLSRRTG